MSEPLRPQTLGEILDRTTQLYRARFLVFLGISLAPAGVTLGLSFAVGLVAAWWSWYGARSMSAGAGYVLVGIFALVATLLAAPLLLGAASLAEAAMSHAVSRVYLGETTQGEATIRGAYKSVWPRGWRYVGLFTLQALIIGVAPWIAWTILVFIAAIIAATAEKTGAGTAEGGFLVATIMTLSMLALVGYVIWMLVQLSLAFPASVVEQIGAGRALKRSWRLVKGSKGRIFLLYLLAAVLSWVLLFGITIMAAIILQLIPATRSGHHGTTYGTIMAWVFLISAVGIQMLLKPILGIAQVLFYYDQRIRQEGFDIEWMMLQAGLTPPAAPAPVAAPWLPAAPRSIQTVETETSQPGETA